MNHRNGQSGVDISAFLLLDKFIEGLTDGHCGDRVFRLFALRWRHNLRGQIGRENHVFIAQGTSAFDGILELPHIAGIIVVAKNIDRLGVDFLRLSAGGARLFLQEVIHQQWNIFEPLAERRYFDRDDRQPVIKILAERAVLHLALEDLVGRPDDANVHGNALVVADAADFPLLQNAEKFRLQGRRHRIHFIEKNRAEIRFFKQSALVGDGARKRALLVAEQF